MLGPLRRWLDRRIDERVDRIVHHQPFVWGDVSRLSIAPTAVLNDALLNVSSGRIVIEDWAMLAHRVTLLTGAHDYHRFNQARQETPLEGRDIVVGEGAWLASNVTVIGPCRIGRHAVVGAGSVVSEDIPDYAVAWGNPARVMATIPHDEAG